MPKRTHSETVTPTVTPATAAAESPKKRGRPCKKLDPLPKDVMKALGILNNYVEKQQAQAQAQAQAEAASDSEVAAISSPEVSEETPPAKRKRGRPKKTKSPSPEVSEETPPVKKKRGRPKKPKSPSPDVSEETPPVKRKGGWPKGKPRKPKSPSPDVSEEAKPKEDAQACSPASSPDEKSPKKGGSKKAEVAKKKKATIEERFEALSDKLVPFCGPADTVEGEIVSAVDKILYRCLNDGDHFAVGYGAETAGPAMEYLTEADSIPEYVREDFHSWAFGYQHEDYSEETARNHLMRIAVDYIEGKELKDYIKNNDSYRLYDGGKWTID